MATFAEVAPLLLKHGYEPVPAALFAGGKAVVEKGWTTVDITQKVVRDWAAEQPDANVAIRTEYTPAIDIDVTDAALAEQLEVALCLALDGAAVRVGRAPKRLILFRTDTPFRKVAVVMAPPGVDLYKPEDRPRRHAVEFLGKGQQCLAYGIHRDTKKPYTWTGEQEPLNTPAADLQLLTLEGLESAIRIVESLAQAAGWKTRRSGAPAEATLLDDALESFSPPLPDIDETAARKALGALKSADDYDQWVQVGMALQHQFWSDSETGLAMWHEWSQQSDAYDPEALDAKWESFSSERHGGPPTTFKYVLKLASESRESVRSERMDEVRERITACASTNVLYTKITRDIGVLLESDVEVDLVVDWIAKRGKDIDGSAPGKATLRKAVRHAYLKTLVNRKAPDWLKNWVYVSSAEEFYHLEQHRRMTERAFNAVHNRLLLSEEDRAAGKAVPEVQASALALNAHEIECVDAYAYFPSAASIFEQGGVRFANTYDERGMPEMPLAYTAANLAAIQRFERHVALLFPEPCEQAILLDWLSWVVQHPGDHPRWGILIQGVAGAGKSFFSDLLSGVLGSSNVKQTSPAAIVQDRNTEWAENRRVTVIEEIRMHGENRFAALDKLKPYITNTTVPVRRMYAGEVDVPNVTAYLMFANPSDALPLDDCDRRYAVLSTHFQRPEALAAFNDTSPTYFTTLFAALHGNRGATLRWLLERPQSPEFKPFGKAPTTAAKGRMIDAAAGEQDDDLRDLIDEGVNRLVCGQMLHLPTLKALAADRGVSVPHDRRLRQVLDSFGFSYLGNFRNGVQRYKLWSRFPEKYAPETASEYLNAPP